MTLFSMGPLTVSAKVPLGFGNIPPEVFCQKSVLKNFAKFTEKHLCQNVSARASACNFIKKETVVHVFFCEIYEI